LVHELSSPELGPLITGNRGRSFEQRLKRGEGAAVGIRRSQKAVRGVMAQIYAAQFPHELVHIQAAPQLTERYRLANYLGQQIPPFAFHLLDFVPDWTFNVVELEQSGSHRTPARQTCALCPTEPVRDQSFQPRQSRFGFHGRSQDSRTRELGHVRQQSNLHFFFAALR
jgi:hypothetical protein